MRKSTRDLILISQTYCQSQPDDTNPAYHYKMESHTYRIVHWEKSASTTEKIPYLNETGFNRRKEGFICIRLYRRFLPSIPTYLLVEYSTTFSRMWRTYTRYVGHYINLLTRNTNKKQEAHDQFGMHNMYSSVCRRNYSLFPTTKEMNHVPPLLPSCTKQSNVLRRNWNEENYRFLLEEG